MAKGNDRDERPPSATKRKRDWESELPQPVKKQATEKTRPRLEELHPAPLDSPPGKIETPRDHHGLSPSEDHAGRDLEGRCASEISLQTKIPIGTTTITTLPNELLEQIFEHLDLTFLGLVCQRWEEVAFETHRKPWSRQPRLKTDLTTTEAEEKLLWEVERGNMIHWGTDRLVKVKGG